jgi:hypothetical protein
MVMTPPMPMPRYERPVRPGDQPRSSLKTIGYETKQLRELD